MNASWGLLTKRCEGLLSKATVELPELASEKLIYVKASARVNNRAENSHQPTHERESQSVIYALLSAYHVGSVA